MKFFKYVEENFLGISFFILCITLFGLSIILQIKVAKSDIFNSEKECFNFYKENNYVLEECKNYEKKLKKGENNEK